jgi:hypothetical protein
MADREVVGADPGAWSTEVDRMTPSAVTVSAEALKEVLNTPSPALEPYRMSRALFCRSVKAGASRVFTGAAILQVENAAGVTDGQLPDMWLISNRQPVTACICAL